MAHQTVSINASPTNVLDLIGEKGLETDDAKRVEIWQNMASEFCIKVEHDSRIYTFRDNRAASYFLRLMGLRKVLP